MKQQTFYIVFFLLISTGALLLSTDAVAYNLRQISSKDGLSNSSINCLFQDDKRFLWIGTFDGLNMYDGRNIYIYKPDANNRYSLSSNVIRDIVETDKKFLWISTKWGLNKLSQEENIIIEYHKEFKEDSYIAKDSEEHLFVLGKDALLSVYDDASHTFTDLPIDAEITYSLVRGFFVDAKDTIWINCKGSMEKYTVSFRENNPPEISRHPDCPHPCPVVFTSFCREQILFTDSVGCLYVIDADKKKAFIKDISSLLKENGDISSIIFDHNDILIGFKTNGLVRLQFQHQYKEEKIDVNCGVFSLRKDEVQDIVWIGTDGQGVYAWTKDDYRFNNLSLAQFPVRKQRPVRAILTDAQNNLWIGTKDNGVICVKDYSVKKEYSEQDVMHYTIENGLVNNGVFAFARSSDPDVLWIGSDGPDVNYYSYQDRKIHTLINNTPRHAAYVHSIFESHDSVLWTGSGRSLLKFIINHNGNQLSVTSSQSYSFQLTNNQPFNQIYALHQESDSIIWTGVRGNGIIRFNTLTEHFDVITFEDGIAPMRDVLCIHQDSDGILWLGTSYGLIRLIWFNDGRHEYKNYNENDGLPNNTIHGILSACNGDLWLSSNTGIILFNPAAGTFRSFNQKTGLKTIEFSDNAYFRDEKTSTCFFGGVDGLVYMKKVDNERQRFIPEIRFTKLRIFNEDYSLFDFEKVKNGESYIELKNKQNYFAVSFVAVDFMNGENSRYSYRLKNFSDVWMDTRSSEAQFTNISPGSYVLQVRYNDGSSYIDNQIQSLRILILPPWYLTAIAKVLYGLLLLAAVATVFYYVRLKYEMRQKKIDRQLQEKYKEDVYESKLRFFTNITHELSTPLTLIYGPCERILAYEGLDSFIGKYVQIIKSNAERLNSLIQEIIDFRRIETGNQICKIQNMDISRLTNDLVVAFDELAEQNHILVEINLAPDIHWNTDESGYTKIVNNLISNAFKYTPEGGCIRISLLKEEQLLVLKVYNTGKGIPAENIPFIFNRYTVFDNVKENSIKGLSSRNGLGLAICYSMTQMLQGNIEVDSVVDEYAQFSVTLPCLEVDSVKDDGLTSMNSLHSLRRGKKPASPTLKQERIVVIDDNRELLWMLQDILSNEYAVSTAEDGSKGLELIKEELPDLIITDVMMPYCDGITLTRKLKENKHTMHIPLIILSAKNANEERVEGIESGADAYIPKPFNTAYLKAVIRHQIKNRKRLEEYYNSSGSAFEFADGQLMKKEDKDFLQTATDCINNNIDNTQFSTEELAVYLGVSSRNLYRRFKEMNGPTPNDLIKELRLKTAAKLMLTTTLTIQEVMYKTGFSNRTHFYKEFTKRYSKSPKEYRETNKKKDETL
ncbi:MAG: response regulator [Tannerella sp.]|jgi:signal transduction histidine kinase/DNA-binding response OmpR family regulator/ligand-binding sensor domain-containing protein|nr:response regulator [Tannerella sp.]